MLKRYLSVALLVLAGFAGIEAGKRRSGDRNCSFDCQGTAGLTGVRGTTQAVAGSFVGPTLSDNLGTATAGSFRSTILEGCGFKVSPTTVCIQNVSAFYPNSTINPILNALNCMCSKSGPVSQCCANLPQDFGLPFVLEYAFETEYTFDTPLCKTPSVVFQEDFSATPSILDPQGPCFKGGKPANGAYVPNPANPTGPSTTIPAAYVLETSYSVAHVDNTHFVITVIATIAVTSQMEV